MAGVTVALACSGRAEAAGNGYITVGGGRYDNFFASGPLRQFSGGGEGLFGGNFGVGGDGSLVVGGGDALVVTALHATVHMRQHNRAISMDPFVRGGYSRLSALTESGGTNAITFGGGFNHWISDGRAWIAEFRAVKPAGQVGSRYWTASVGIGFR
jgi:hypothetical protein